MGKTACPGVGQGQSITSQQLLELQDQGPSFVYKTDQCVKNDKKTSLTSP